MTMPPQLQDSVETALATRVRDAQPVSGGEVCQAWRLQTSDGALFLKTHANAPQGLFEAEARGLQLLRDANALRTPEVLAWRDIKDQDDESGHAVAVAAFIGVAAWLALEWIETAAPRDEDAFSRSFAEGLALQHRVSSEVHGNANGHENFLGVMRQSNAPTPDWAEFLRVQRLAPMIADCEARGALPKARREALQRVSETLETLLDDGDNRPVLLHGDLWSGNFLSLPNGNALLIDPAAYFGSREMELAYVQLFDGFPHNFVRHYDLAFPLFDGYERRRPVLQLYPLLAHLLYFGERYGPRVDATLAQILER